MSQMGQKQTFPEPERMSALSPEADIGDRCSHVCFGPFPDSCAAADKVLLDNLVGEQLQRIRHREAEGCGGLEIDDEFVLERKLIDSGFRTGADVAKAVALGASAVQVGRAALYGLAAGGETGVCQAIGIISDEFERAMALTGSTSVAALRGRVGT
jgi:(S)-mandelate dehydrogenase